jgi:hypothetical protein
MKTQLIRRQIRPSERAIVDEWMAVLRERRAECVATLERERMAVELIFLERDGDAEYLSWVIVQGDGEELATSTHEIDSVHRAYLERCLLPASRVTLDALLYLAPDDVDSAIRRAVEGNSPR